MIRFVVFVFSVVCLIAAGYIAGWEMGRDGLCDSPAVTCPDPQEQE